VVGPGDANSAAVTKSLLADGDISATTILALASSTSTMVMPNLNTAL
jgi:hypothetical protein